jgi:hypothetical protein
MNKKVKIAITAVGLVAVAAVTEGARAQMAGPADRLDYRRALCTRAHNDARNEYMRRQDAETRLADPLVARQVLELQNFFSRINDGEREAISAYALYSNGQMSDAEFTAYRSLHGDDLRSFWNKHGELRNNMFARSNCHDNGLHTNHVSSTGVNSASSGSVYFFDSDASSYTCNREGSPRQLPELIVKSRLGLSDSQAQLTICSFSSVGGFEISGPGFIWNANDYRFNQGVSVRVCSSIDLFTGAIIGDSVRSALTHPQALHQNERDDSVARFATMSTDEFVDYTINHNPAAAAACRAVGVLPALPGHEPTGEPVAPRVGTSRLLPDGRTVVNDRELGLYVTCGEANPGCDATVPAEMIEGAASSAAE